MAEVNLPDWIAALAEDSYEEQGFESVEELVSHAVVGHLKQTRETAVIERDKGDH